MSRVVWIGAWLAISCAPRQAPATAPSAAVPAVVVAPAPAPSLDRGCEDGDARACTTAGRGYLDHPSHRVRNAFRALHLLRLGCARGDARACETIALRSDRVTKELATAYAQRGCQLGGVVGCAVAATPHTPAQERAIAALATACHAGDLDACTFGARLPELEASAPFAIEETTLTRAACDRGDGASCAMLATWLSSGYEAPVRKLDGAGTPSPLDLTVRACTLGHQHSCLALVDLGTPISDELLRASERPDVAQLIAAQEAACKRGRVEACAWRAQSLVPMGDDYKPWEELARAALATACSTPDHEGCEDALSALVDLARPHDIGLTLSVPTDDACAKGSILACVIVAATSFAEERDQRVAAAFRNAEAAVGPACAKDHLRCAAHAELVLRSTRHMTYLVERGDHLAGRLFRASCGAADVAGACSEGAELAASPAERDQMRAASQTFTAEMCEMLRGACGGTQCDPACLVP